MPLRPKTGTILFRGRVKIRQLDAVLARLGLGEGGYSVSISELNTIR